MLLSRQEADNQESLRVGRWNGVTKEILAALLLGMFREDVAMIGCDAPEADVKTQGTGMWAHHCELRA